MRAILRRSCDALVPTSPSASREDVERADELGPVAALLVDLLEDARPPRRVSSACSSSASRAPRAPVVLRVEEEDLAVVLERAGGVAEVLLERLTEAELEVDELVLVASSSMRRRSTSTYGSQRSSWP